MDSSKENASKLNDLSIAYDLDANLNSNSNEEASFHCGFFNSQSDSYVHSLRTLVDHVSNPLRKLMKKGNHKLLDLGCGLGYPTAQVAKTLRIPTIGIDLSATSIQICKKKHHMFISENLLQFDCQNAYETTFYKETFDGVFAIESLFHMKKELVIQEIYRILKKGGTVSICDYYAKKNWEEVFWEGHSNNESLLRLLNIFEKTGFKRIQFHDYTKQVEPSFAHWKKRKVVSQMKKNWDQFCNNAVKIAGYIHIIAEK